MVGFLAHFHTLTTVSSGFRCFSQSRLVVLADIGVGHDVIQDSMGTKKLVKLNGFISTIYAYIEMTSFSSWSIGDSGCE